MDNTVPSGGQRSMQQPVSQPTQPQPVTTKPDTTVSTVTDEEKKNLNEQQQMSNPGKEFGPMMSASPSESGGQVEADDDEDEIKVARQEIMLGTKAVPVKEVQISKELQEAGVEQGADTEKEIPLVVQRAGMRVTDVNSAVPESAVPSAKKLPINYAHAVQLDKQSTFKESIKWLARFIKRQWEKLQYAEKEKPVV